MFYLPAMYEFSLTALTDRNWSGCVNVSETQIVWIP